MEHLQAARLVETSWDGDVLTVEEQDHLRLCEECRHQFAMYRQMGEEFEIARRSEMSPETEVRYLTLFVQRSESTQIESSLRKWFGTLAEWVVAVPLWDSRQQALAAGVRTAHNATYRMLFGAEETEVELMVEPQNGLLRLVGEVMRKDADESNGLALIELMAASGAHVALETESDESGHFQLERVPPGIYRLAITPRYSQMVVIEPLGLT